MKRTILLLVVAVMLLSVSAIAWAGATPPISQKPGGGIKSALEMSRNPPPTQSFALQADLSCVVGTMALLHPGVFTVNNKILKITKDQEDKIKTIITTATAEIGKQKENVRTQNIALREALLADKYDNAKITKLMQSSMEAESALANSEMRAWTQIRSVLTLEQVKLLRDGLSRHTPSSASPFPGVQTQPSQQGAPVIMPNGVRRNTVQPTGELPN
jgi:Spy/CpxP family protein refolding chaperone